MLRASVMSIRELDLLQTCLEMQLCEPIDLQSERPSMNAAPFCKHSRYRYTQSLKRFYILYLTVNFLITPATETFIFQ